MRRALPAGSLPYVLIALIALLAASLAAVLWRGTDTAALLRTPARPMINPRLVAAAPDTSGLVDIKTRALFYVTRRFFVSRAQPSAVQVPPPAYQLDGTLLIPGKPGVAFLKHQPDGAAKTVHPGDALDGWKVAAVETGGVVLAQGTRHIEITAKGLTSVAHFPPAQMPGTFHARHAQRHVVILGARQARKVQALWTNTGGTLQRHAARVYRPPN